MLNDNDKKIDPIVMYLIIRDSLQMSPGKIAAQCGHGVQYCLINYFKIQALDIKAPGCISEKERIWAKTMKDWFSGSKKVVLRADEKEWNKIKEENDPHFFFIVKDAGCTEVTPGSETVICMNPVYKSQRSKMLKKLRVY